MKLRISKNYMKYLIKSFEIYVDCDMNHVNIDISKIDNGEYRINTDTDMLRIKDKEED